MPVIATNIFKKLTDQDKKELQEISKGFGGVEISEYIQKGLDVEEVVKYILDGFALKNIVRDAILWDSFKALLRFLFNIAVRKFNKIIEMQIWIRDINNPAAINITFSIKEEKEVQDLFVVLRSQLENEIFIKRKESEKGKIIWVAFDRETKSWLIKTL